VITGTLIHSIHRGKETRLRGNTHIIVRVFIAYKYEVCLVSCWNRIDF